jgi:hypothetical protein
MSHAHRRALAAGLVTAFMTAGAVAADEGATAALAERAAAQAAATANDQPAAAATRPAAAPAGSSLLTMKPVDPKTLAGRRGGADVLNDMKLKGVVSDNRAVNVTTGNNVISEGAFAGTTGLPMVVQNTGNNVLIQNATIVNVQVK